jgi:sulfane dehydrogenase subunit SoxC
MSPKQTDRRRFLKNGAALAGLAVGASASALSAAAEPALEKIDELHLYGERSHYVTSVRNGSINNPERRLKGEQVAFGLRTPLQDSVGMITPSSLHFTISHGFEPPDIDPKEHHLLIHGMVDRPLIFSVDELKRLPYVTRFHFVECHGNSSPRGPGGDARISVNATPQETHGFTSCSQWTGVPLSLLLKEVGVQKGATWIIAEGADEPKHSKSIPIGKALDDALVAYAQNGEPVRPEQGFPLRLLVPGWEGNINVKWLRRIKVVDQPYMTRSETRIYSVMRPDGKARWFELEMPPKSVITFPSGGQQLPGRGFYEITGLAWSGSGAIRSVEVSTDGGQSWKDAQLQEPVHRMAHSRFCFPWNWSGEEAVLQSRCRDELGQVQPTLAELSKVWGASLDYWQTTKNYINHFNPIHSWKVTREGSVHNALFD